MVHTYKVLLEWQNGHQVEVHTYSTNCKRAAHSAVQTWGVLAGSLPVAKTVVRIRVDPVEAALLRYGW